MRKKIFATLFAILTAMTANAQFQAGKVYVGGSLSGMSLNYSGNDKLKLGVNAMGGYFVDDDVLIYGQIGYDHSGNKYTHDKFMAGVGGRYYIEENGLYLAANCKLMLTKGHNDVMPGVEVGYAYFINRSVTIEPAIYYDQSIKSHKDFSTIGLKIGVGIYLFDD